MKNGKIIVIATVGKFTFFVLLLIVIAMFTQPAIQGISYFYFDNMSNRSIYIRAYGYPAYSFLITAYFGAIYLVLINIFYLNSALYIKNNELFCFWRKICDIRDIDFKNIKFGYTPLSIIFFIKNERKTCVTAFLNKSNSEIIQIIEYNVHLLI